MRLIDADKFEVYAYSNTSLDFDAGVLSVLEKLDAAPTVDAVAVIRCKDCKKSRITETGKRYCKEPMGEFLGCIPVKDDFFCGGAVRRTKTDDDQ